MNTPSETPVVRVVKWWGSPPPNNIAYGTLGTVRSDDGVGHKNLKNSKQNDNSASAS